MVYGGKRYLEIKKEKEQALSTLSVEQLLDSKVASSKERNIVYDIFSREGVDGLRIQMDRWIDESLLLHGAIALDTRKVADDISDTYKQLHELDNLIRLASLIISRK